MNLGCDRSATLTQQPKARLTVVIVILAAGKAARMGEGGQHKLLAEFDGIPLVRRAAMIACSSRADGTVLVTGHRHIEITAAVEGVVGLRLVHNADYDSGMASSIIAGVRCNDVKLADGMLIFHADMPGIGSSELDRLITAFHEAKGGAIVRATSGGKLGNPVILPRTLYDNVLSLRGDIGARQIIEVAVLPVVEVDIGDAARLDVDTPEAVVLAGGVLKN